MDCSRDERARSSIFSRPTDSVAPMGQVVHRTISTNGISMHIAEQGEGPLVILCHGFPELWYSWRHQLAALAEAGYHVVAPDMRGYGQTDRPLLIEDYGIDMLTSDLLGLLDALGEERAVFVGHDWGASVVWSLAQRAPERVRGVAGLSVPFRPRGSHDPISTLEFLFGDNFFYILYFQEPGIADTDLARDVEDSLRRAMRAFSVDEIEGSKGPLPASGTGWREWTLAPGLLPAWLSSDDLDYYVSEFTRTGFTGGLNWYRNLRRNWENSASLAEIKIVVPAVYLIGELDQVARFMSADKMDEWVTDLRVKRTIQGAGHWLQQERPDVVNEVLVDFLASLD